MYEVHGKRLTYRGDLKFVTTTENKFQPLESGTEFIAEIPSEEEERKAWMKTNKKSTELPVEEQRQFLVMKRATMDHADYKKEYQKHISWFERTPESLDFLQDLIYVEYRGKFMKKNYFYLIFESHQVFVSSI